MFHLANVKLNKSHTRIYYLPGLISLVLLPLFFIPYILIKSTPKAHYCFEINMPEICIYGSNMGKDKISLDMDLPIFKRTYSYYVFTKKGKDNLKAIDEGVQKMIVIQRNKDSIHALGFVFKDVCYSDFIYLLNALRKNRINLCLVFGDTVKTYYLPPAPILKQPKGEEIVYMMCGTAQMNNLLRLRDLEIENEKHFVELRWNYLMERKAPLLILTLAFLAFCIIAFKKCRNLNWFNN